MEDKNLSRRRFLETVAVAVPVSTLLAGRHAAAQDLPKLTEDDPAAKALLYVHDAANVDTSQPLAARFMPGQHCGNCAQIQGDEGPEWRPCAIFPGKLVSVNGWCSVWAMRA
jgi:hypothetical protein